MSDVLITKGNLATLQRRTLADTASAESSQLAPQSRGTDQRGSPDGSHDKGTVVPSAFSLSLLVRKRQRHPNRGHVHRNNWPLLKKVDAMTCKDPGTVLR